MSILNFLLVTVVVGLLNGNQVTIEDAQFVGFLETRDGDQAVLLYRQESIHGELPAELIARIDFGYIRGEPFLLTVTLKNGQRLDVQNERRKFIRVEGQTPNGRVIVQHPDPRVGPVRLTTRAPDLRDNLTIQFIEFR